VDPNGISSPLQQVPSPVSLWVQQLGHKADHSPTSSVNIKNEYIYIPQFPLYVMVCVGVTLPSLFTNCIILWSLSPPPSVGFTCMHNMNTSSSLYQLNAHTYLYRNIFPTFLLHVSVCYAPSSGWAIHISAKNHMFFTRLLSMVTCVTGYKMPTIYIYIYIYIYRVSQEERT